MLERLRAHKSRTMVEIKQLWATWVEIMLEIGFLEVVSYRKIYPSGVASDHADTLPYDAELAGPFVDAASAIPRPVDTPKRFADLCSLVRTKR